MKRTAIVILALALVLTLASCAESNSTSSQNKATKDETEATYAWPQAQYIKPDMKYSGKGEIVGTPTVESDSNEKGVSEKQVYYLGSDMEDIKSYVEQLKKAGFKYYSIDKEKEPDYQFIDGRYEWQGEKTDSEQFVIVFLSEKPLTYANTDRQFNMYISMMDSNLYK